MAKKKPAPTRPRRPTFIKAWREALRLSQAQVIARMEEAGVDFSEGQLSRVERGKSAYTQDTLEALADALGVTTIDLIGRDPADALEFQQLSSTLSPEDLASLLKFGRALAKAS